MIAEACWIRGKTHFEELSKIVGLCYGEKMSDAKPVKCQKCGKSIGYVTVVARGISPFQQPVPDVKIVAICMECSRKKE
jgi:hypothetical protein